MKIKSAIITCIFIGLVFQAKAQKVNPVLSDAIYLFDSCIDKKKQNLKDFPKIRSVLKNYYSGTISDTVFNTNPFFKKYMSFGDTLSRETAPEREMKIVKMTEDFGSMDVTSVADGFAKFIVNRTKQELSIAFFDRFSEVLNDPELKDMQLLFPHTHRVFKSIGSHIYMYQAFLGDMRLAFKEDLNYLPDYLPAVFENHRDYFDSLPALKATILSSVYLANSLRNKLHPGKILENYPSDGLEGNVYSSVQLLKRISAALKNPESGSKYWFSGEQVSYLLNMGRDTVADLFLGLLYEQNRQYPLEFVSEGKTVKLNAILESAALVKEDLKKWKNIVNTLALKMQNIEISRREMAEQYDDSAKREAYFQLADRTLELFDIATQLDKYPFLKIDDKVVKNLENYSDLLHASLNFSLNINRKEYSSAMLNLSVIWTQLSDISYLKAKPNNKYLKKTQEKLARSRNYIFRYGSFAAAMVEAKTSGDAEAIIATFAMPAGSARIKRESAYNVSFNAYCGFFTGYERIKNLDNRPKLNSYGITAPIGISFSKGVRYDRFHSKGTRKGGASYSVFLSAVDIGALAAFRFNTANDTVSAVPKVELKDIVSPGIFLSYGIPKSPVSINFGYQTGPLLRKVTAVMNNYGTSYSRISLSVCIDLPLANLHTSPH